MPKTAAAEQKPDDRDLTQVANLTEEMKVLRLIAALNKVQAVLTPASKDATNPHFKSKYATLASSWEAVRKPLADNGFAVVQTPIMVEGGAVNLHTVLYHIDGANIDCFYPVVYGPAAAPALGAALKYARRYSLETLIGVTTADDAEDDDGNKAPAPPAQRQQVQRTPNPPAPATIEGARPTLKDQAVSYITSIEAAKTWDEFMAAIAAAGDLVERIRAADKSGQWVTRINEVVGKKRDTLETPETKHDEDGAVIEGAVDNPVDNEPGA